MFKTAASTVGAMPQSRYVKKAYRQQPMLLSTGPYHDYSVLVASLIPGVDVGDVKNRFIPMQDRPASVTMLSLNEGTKPYSRDFADVESLQQHFDHRRRKDEPSQRRIYILEGLNTDYISAIGGFFFMDPQFFANQEQVSIWEKNHSGAFMTESLPSLVDSQDSICLPYYEMRYFIEPIRDFRISCHATGRHFGVTRLGGGFAQEVVVRRKCSFWSRENEDGGWDVVILTDPPIKDVRHGGKNIIMPNIPFQSGYRDFIPGSTSSRTVPSGPPRTCMRDDLIHYWRTRYTLFPSLSSPRVAALFIRKIAASHYMQLLLWTRSLVSSQEWYLSRRNDLAFLQANYVEEQWSDLQALNRRSLEYAEDVERIMLALGIKSNEPDFSHDKRWMESDKDFQLIYARLKVLKTRCEVLLGSVTALTGIVGNRQSLDEARRSFREAKNVKILTVVGMVFIPLAFICGIFSMNDSFLPGATHFWIYWASAVPLIVIVFLGAVIANWGYDDDAGTWSVKNVWHAMKRMIGMRDRTKSNTPVHERRLVDAWSLPSTRSTTIGLRDRDS